MEGFGWSGRAVTATAGMVSSPCPRAGAARKVRTASSLVRTKKQYIFYSHSLVTSRDRSIVDEVFVYTIAALHCM
jgi:hypothetical protein